MEHQPHGCSRPRQKRLPAQWPISVFIHQNTLHALEHLPFERAVTEASQLYGTEPYMSEAAYRKDFARGRIHIDDINAVHESEPDAVVFPGLPRRSAMITPRVREFDGATILWRTEQGDLARDSRRAALRTVFDACFERTVVHEEEPASPRPIDEIIHLWPELLALPGWAGLMRKLEESPGLAPPESVLCSLMDFLAVRLTMSRVDSRMGATETVPRENRCGPML